MNELVAGLKTSAVAREWYAGVVIAAGDQHPPVGERRGDGATASDAHAAIQPN